MDEILFSEGRGVGIKKRSHPIKKEKGCYTIAAYKTRREQRRPGDESRGTVAKKRAATQTRHTEQEENKEDPALNRGAQ